MSEHVKLESRSFLVKWIKLRESCVSLISWHIWTLIQDIHNKIKPEEVELVRRDYVANEGWETFLSYEDTRQV